MKMTINLHLLISIIFILILNSLSSSIRMNTIFKLKNKECLELLHEYKDNLNFHSFTEYLHELNIIIAKSSLPHSMTALQLNTITQENHMLNDCIEISESNSEVYLQHVVNLNDTDSNIDPSFIGWHLKRINVEKLPLPIEFTRKFIQSNDVETHIFVIDSGINRHKDLVERLSLYDNRSFIEDPQCEVPLDPFCDKVSHGTHVAGIIASDIAGYNNKSIIHSLKVCINEEMTNWVPILQALNYVLELKKKKYKNHLVFVNLSLAGEYKESINHSMEILFKNNIFPIVAAGNYNGFNACTLSPTSSNYVISVGASTIHDTLALYSNRGSCVKVYAPGSSIYSLKNMNDSYSLKSGTSMATPLVTGFLSALVSSKKIYNTTEMMEEFMKHTLVDVNSRIPLLITDSLERDLLDNSKGKDYRYMLKKRDL